MPRHIFLILCANLCGFASVSLGDKGQANDSVLVPLVQLLGQVDDPAFHRDVLKGIHEAIKGRRAVKMPDGWKAVSGKLLKSPNREVRKSTMELSVIFGDSVAMDALRQKAGDKTASREDRAAAIRALAQKLDPKLLPVLYRLLDDRKLRGTAIRTLATFNDAEIPNAILDRYATLDGSEKRDAVNTLASRGAYAAVLLNAIAEGRVASRDVSTFTARQIWQLNDVSLQKKLERVWGSVRATSEDKQAIITKYKTFLTKDFLKKANRSQGRLVFSKTCAICHKLFGEGKAIGPELTGAQRNNLDYVLSNLIDPSAVVGRDYRMTAIATLSGRVVTGIVKQEDDSSVTIQTSNDVVTIPLDEIDERNRSRVSMMPEGMLDKLKTEEVRDLVSYLAGPNQVRLPKGD